MKRTFLLASIGAILCTGGLNAQEHLQNGKKVEFNEIPAAVQNTVKQHAGQATIEDIDRGTLSGRTVYEVAFKENGKHNELRVAEDGTVIDRIVEGKSIGTTAQVTTPATTTETSRPHVTAGTGKAGDGLPYDAGFEDSLRNTRKISFDELPAPVKQVVQERTRDRTEIQDVERGSSQAGVTAYQIAYKKKGRHIELRVTENGQRIKEVADGKQIYREVPASLNQLPANIRQTINSRIGDQRITRIGMGENRGVDFYRVFYNKNGQNMELRIAGNDVRDVAAGSVISDPAGAEIE